MNEALLRDLAPAVTGILVRRGADFASAEDAVQEALVSAIGTWEDRPPDNPKAWLTSVAWRKFLDAARSRTSAHNRDVAFNEEPVSEPPAGTDETLQLYFLCAHPALSSASAVALTLRAVGGLTTAQVASAYMVPEATMAQRISRAKRSIEGQPLDQPGNVNRVLQVLYLVFNEGYNGDLDLAAEAIRLGKQLASLTTDPEVDGLLALMLLHHARRGARSTPQRSLVPLHQQDRSLWDTQMIADGVELLQSALAADQLGPFQAQAAIAALHADATSTAETDWVQIVEWYDELLSFGDNPVVRLNRAVAVCEADGPQAGMTALHDLSPALPRYTAVLAFLSERSGDLTRAGDLYVEAANAALNIPERDHLTREAARMRQLLQARQ